MLTLVTASRFEALEELLLVGLMQPAADPLASEPVLVPSAAVRHRLALAVADRHGVCAQIEFAFLAEWLWRQIAVVIPDVPAHSPFDPATLRWRIDACLQDPALVAAHPRLAGWLADADALMRFSLADRLAALFDQYLTYRPDWLAGWSAGQLRATSADAPLQRADESWQAALWRRLERDVAGGAAPVRHPTQLFLAALAEGGLDARQRARLPARVRVFCLPGMPPLYLDVLTGLARHLDVELYVLNPCRDFWFDLASPRVHARRSLAGEAGHLEVGHRLLASWGRQTQSWLERLYANPDPAAFAEREADETRVPAPADTLLARLQAGIRDLQDPAPGVLADAVLPDGSLEIHVCHSLTRQLEVLHDRLLTRLAAPAPPAPGEILVVVPDLSTAAPLIEQVFGHRPRALALPYVITGLPPATANPLARALLDLLALARGRMPASAVLAVLQQPAVGACFGLAGSALEDLARRLREADVHWGLDAAHRADCDLPATARGTFRDGLERLWLGFALPEGHAHPWQDRLPALDGGDDPLPLGALQTFLQRLDGLRRALAQPLRPRQWQGVLEGLVRDFLDPGRSWLEPRAALLAELQAHLRELAEAGVDRAQPAELLCRALDDRLAAGPGGGVPGGAITFAALSSLRLLPHRVVCVLGLDDGVFPAPVRPLEFDLIAARPRPGDRQRGEDDRNLFLDLLLAAREAVHLSYSGRSVRDNGERPPSVVLAELLDVLVPALAPADADEATLAAVRARLLCHHPLQPFDERYFDPAQPQLPGSYREDFAAALRARALAAAASAVAPPAMAQSGPLADAGFDQDDDEADEAALDRAAQVPFFAFPLPPLEPEWRQLTLERLSRFLHHPGRMLLQDRLGLRLPDPAAEWQDSEDFLPARKASQRLAQRLLPVLLADPDGDPQRLENLAQAGADYPEGPLGQAALRAEIACLRSFAATVQSLGQGALLPARSVEWRFARPDGEWCLQAPLEGLRDGRLFGWDYGTRGISTLLPVWLRHLWVCAHADGAVGPTEWVLRDATVRLQPLAAQVAREQLAGLVDLYAQGMCRPLHFFRRTAWTWCEKGEAAARRTWLGAPFQDWSEARDAAWRLALRGVADPLDAEFRALAAQVLQPLAEAIK